jgi:thiol:disulfide interchange protein DsbD
MAFQQKMGEVHVTAVDGANPFGYIAGRRGRDGPRAVGRVGGAEAVTALNHDCLHQRENPWKRTRALVHNGVTMKQSKVLALAALGAIGLALVPAILPTGPSSSLDAAKLLDGGRLLVAAGVIFLGGLLTSLTPCVYPLIPITVGVFGARQADSRGRAFVLTTAYVVGMGAVFSALGVFAALSGKAFGSALGSTWVVLGLVAFLIALATSMFGAFELALPTSLATKLSGVGGGGVVGALLMGSVAGFLAAPCTGPVLTGVLAWVARTQDPLLGGGFLFIYALGIGVPFFLIGVFTVRLPKSGPWMESIKSFFGVALLALAASYLRDTFGPLSGLLDSASLALGGATTIVIASALAFAGVALGAIHLSFKQGGQWVLKGAGVTLLVVGFLLRMAAGHEGAQGSEAYQWAMVFNGAQVKTSKPFDAALAQAKADCKPVMIDFFAEWCAACKELDEVTYTAKEVLDESRRFVSIKVDGTEDDELTASLQNQFGVQGLPTVAFVDHSGKVLQSPRVTGFLPPEAFLKEMQKVAIASCTAAP